MYRQVHMKRKQENRVMVAVFMTTFYIYETKDKDKQSSH